MSYYDHDDDDYALRIDYGDVDRECDSAQSLIHEATGDKEISVGYHEVDSYTYEVWITGGLIGDKEKYFQSIDEMLDEVKALYPDVDWDI